MRKIYFSGIIAILLLTSIGQAFGQKNPPLTSDARTCFRTPATSEQLALRTNPALIAAERERVKSSMSVAQRKAEQAKAAPTVVANSTSSLYTESVFVSGTLSSADPVFNRSLPHAQGAACPGLSAVGTAVHYKTHTFTLTVASNVTLSVDPVDAGSVTPAGSDTYIALYSPAGFIPGSACTNSIAADDDGGVGFTSRLTTTTPLAPGTYTAVITTFENEPIDFPWNYTLAILFTSPAVCAPGNIAIDGSFETTSSVTLVNPSWPSTSTNFGSPFCDAFNCGNGGGTAAPRTGNFWAWFGGVGGAEVATAEQAVVIPVGATINLNFYMRIGAVNAPFNSTLRVLVDGVTQTTYTEPAVAEAAYTLRTVSLSPFADGNSHTIRFVYDNPAGSGVSNFNVDDVSFDIVSCGPCVAPTITTQPSNSYVCIGATSTFSVVAAGSAPTYQWQENISGTFANITNGGVYSGATSANLTVTGSVAMSGRQYRVVITNPCGTVTSNPAVLTVNQTTHISASATPNSSICSPGATTITGTAGGTSAGGNLILAQSGVINLAIPDGNPAGVSSVINVPQSIATAADLKLRLNMRHSWVGDLRITLTSPCGTTLVFDRPGVPGSTFGNGDNLGTSNAGTPPPAVYIFDIAGATIIPETSVAAGFIPAGTYRPSDGSNPGFAHNWAGLTFPCAAGNWTLTLTDFATPDPGLLVDWAIFKTNVYTHTLTGPGTIVQNPPTGPNNSTGNFSVTAIPAGVHNYVLTSTDGAGCAAVTNLSVTVNPTPVVTIAPAAPVICVGDVQQLTATVVPPVPQLVTGGAGVTISTASGPASPYSANLVVTGLPTSGVTVKSVKLNGVSHTFPGDLDILLQSPSGANVILLSDRGGSTDIDNIDLTFDDAAAGLVPTTIVGGTYRPTNTAGPDVFPAPGPGSITQVNPTLASFGAADYNGVWKLFVVDQFAIDGGAITSWEITFNIPVPVVWTAGPGGAGTIFTNPAGTTPYVAGTPTILPVYVKPVNTAPSAASVTAYTATATRAGCTGSATVNVTANPLPAITVQPAPATQTICPGFNVTYSVTATGVGLTYQWRKNGVNLVNGLQASGSLVSGATTSSVTLIGVVAADAGNYSVVVSSTCPPAVTSSNAALVIATAPTISTQPTSRTVCEGLPTTFTVAATGTPAPTIYQWQVSTNGGGTWTNLTTGGSYTATFTIPAVTLGMNGNLYRVVVTNSCGQFINSSSATLTVSALTPVTATALPATICLSDGPVALVGSPVGGSWSGIGVSGSNFVPTSTAVGTYTLTYSYTNGAGCVSTATVTARVVDGPSCDRINLLRDDAVILYPNPNDGKFNIRINSTLYGFLGMQVYSTSGQLVHKQSFNQLTFGQVIPIDLTKLPSGPYLVKFFYDGGARTSEKTFTVVIGRQ